MTIVNEYAVINQYRETIPVDVQALCKELGVKVHAAYLDSDISGMIERQKKGKFIISFNARDHWTRQRFTIAHELGHYILHRPLIGDGIDDDRAYRSTNRGKYHNTDIGPREETEANRFAADVLMPWKLVKKYREEFTGHPDLLAGDMASKFEVSLQAMTIRLS